MCNQIMGRLVLILAAMPAAIIVGCAVASSNELANVGQQTTSHIDNLREAFVRSGKDRAELVKIGRALIDKVGQPPANVQQCWQVEVARPELRPLLDYLTNVWTVRSVRVGGDAKSRYIEIHIAGRPVGVWVYEKDIVTPVDPHKIGYEAAQPWGPAVMFVCDDRRYGEALDPRF